MGMSGRTFLSAFQMGSRLYPDIVQSREDQIDKKLKRDVIDLQKKKLKEDATIAKAARERKVISQTGYDGFTTGYKALDISDPAYYDKYAALVEEFIVPISMNDDVHKMYSVIDAEVKDAAGYKADVVNRNNTLLAVKKWNEENYLEQVSPVPSELTPEKRKEVNDFYKKHLQEEKSKALRADVEAKGEAETALADKRTFTAFVEETGSAFNPEDYEKPEAKTALRIHNQTEEVKDLIMTVGEDGLPIMAKLRIKSDGSGYENLLAVKAELTTLANKQKTQRGIEGKSLSEQQGNALMYSERLRFSNETMDRMVLEGAVPEKEIVDGWIAEKNKNSAFSISNALLDPKYQVWKSAADNFIRATLRKESGAAIADTEYIGGFKDYISLLGDSEELVAHKRTLRKGIADTMRRIASIPWDESYLPRQPLRFESREQAERFLGKGGWLKAGDKAEYKEGGKIIPFTVKDTLKKKPTKKAVPKPDFETLADPRTNPLLKGAVAPTSIRPAKARDRQDIQVEW